MRQELSQTLQELQNTLMRLTRPPSADIEAAKVALAKLQVTTRNDGHCTRIINFAIVPSAKKCCDMELDLLACGNFSSRDFS